MTRKTVNFRIHGLFLSSPNRKSENSVRGGHDKVREGHDEVRDEHDDVREGHEAREELCKDKFQSKQVQSTVASEVHSF